jgi:Uma2 family endonuclease
MDREQVGRSIDQRVFMYGVSWDEYEAVLAMRGESSGVRIAFLGGTLELMTPSRDHAGIKKALARLVEAYADELGILLQGYGSWTLKRKERGRGLEPDECYCVGSAFGEVPDLAIEVIWTSGGLDKLDIYRGLGVREVWMWQDDEIGVYALRNDRYERIARSEVLPQIDIVLVCSLLEIPIQTDAVRELRARLRAR